MGDADAGLETFRTIGSQCHDRPRRDRQPRPRYDTLIDSGLQSEIRIARALRAEIAFAGEAGEQRCLGICDRARGAECERLMQDLIVPAGFVVRVQEQMPMTLDHAGHQCIPGKLEDARIGGQRKVGPHGDDPVARDQHLPAGMDHPIRAVEDAGWFQEDRCRTGRRQRPRGSK